MVFDILPILTLHIKGNHSWKPVLIKAVEPGGLRAFIVCRSHLNKTGKKKLSSLTLPG